MSQSNPFDLSSMGVTAEAERWRAGTGAREEVRFSRRLPAGGTGIRTLGPSAKVWVSFTTPFASNPVLATRCRPAWQRAQTIEVMERRCAVGISTVRRRISSGVIARQFEAGSPEIAFHGPEAGDVGPLEKTWKLDALGLSWWPRTRPLDDLFSGVNHVTHLKRFLELFYRAWANGRSVSERAPASGEDARPDCTMICGR
jgi:hypothetical protein